jgi:hypothetical protein
VCIARAMRGSLAYCGSWVRALSRFCGRLWKALAVRRGLSEWKARSWARRNFTSCPALCDGIGFVPCARKLQKMVKVRCALPRCVRRFILGELPHVACYSHLLFASALLSISFILRLHRTAKELNGESGLASYSTLITGIVLSDQKLPTRWPPHIYP